MPIFIIPVLCWLKRDLAKRLEKRIHLLCDPNFADAEDERDEDDHTHHKSKKPVSDCC